MVPWSQIYQPRTTRCERPEVVSAERDYTRWYARFRPPSATWRPRQYDVAMTLCHIDVQDKAVAEFGARGSLFAPYIAERAREVHVSDDFHAWEDLGDESYWFGLWAEATETPWKLHVRQVDMRDIPFDTGTFDIVVSYSAIEHIKDGLDDALAELGRVLAPGGHLVLSIEMGREWEYLAGCWMFTAEQVHTVIERSSGCVLEADADLVFEHAEEVGQTKWDRVGVDIASAILFLRKPG